MFHSKELIRPTMTITCRDHKVIQSLFRWTVSIPNWVTVNLLKTKFRLIHYHNHLLLVFSPCKSVPFRRHQLKILLKFHSLWLSLRAKDFSKSLLLLLCCTYRFTALSNWKHQKLPGAANLSMSSGKCRLIKHALAPYRSSQEMQYLQARHLKFSIISSVQPYLPELKTNSTILGTGAHSFNSPSGRNPFKTNSDAGKANFWYSSASRENQEQLALKILSREWHWRLTQSAPLVTFNYTNSAITSLTYILYLVILYMAEFIF